MSVYRPVNVQGAPFIVQRFDKEGALASEIPFVYRHIAEELVRLHTANGHVVRLIEN